VFSNYQERLDMAEENAARTAENEGQNAAGTPDALQTEATKRERSSIAFPYDDLADAVKLAKAIHQNAGAGECDELQLSAWLNVSRKSSGFRQQLSAAKLFGILESSGDRYKLTSLGRAVVDPRQERAAKADAFLKVPLYSAIYEKHKGGVLPPSPVLAQDIVALGVAAKQKDRARQSFERSAQEAGYFEQGKARLVRPGVVPLKEDNDGQATDDDRSGGSGGGGGGKMPPLHPLIKGLIEVLPHDGKTWSVEDATEWLQTAAANFRYAYKFQGRIKVEIDK
jgi:hypothetical protein